MELDERELGPGGDGRRWEEEKLMQAVMKFGAKDAKSKVGLSFHFYAFDILDVSYLLIYIASF